MRSFFLLTGALRYIEDNLENPLTQDAVAAACHSSVSALQKLFRYTMGISVMAYIEKRRLTQAAKLMIDTSLSVTEVALQYQYQSPEVFGRAFRRMWGITPSQFRRTWRFGGLFPRVDGVESRGDGSMIRKMDVTELIEKLQDMDGTYVVLFDMSGLMKINDISHDAGDMAIVECLRRIDAAAKDGMHVFRIGGDEFVLLTGQRDTAVARAVAEEVLAQNGTPIEHQGRQIPLSMHAAAVRMTGVSADQADQLIDSMKETIEKSKLQAELFVQD